MHSCVTALLLLVCAETAQLAAARTCPPPKWDSVKDLDLNKYVAAPWYVQQQVPVTYQPINSFFCTRARYVPVDPTDIKKGVLVLNYSNRDRVNGPANGVSGAAGNRSFTLFAVPAPVPASPTAASKLLVGPRPFLQAAPPAAVAARLGAPQGNYWVVAAGPSKNASLGYDWAIINGGAGAPSGVTPAGCSPSEARDEGFWLFHRQPVAPAADVAKMREVAKGLGYDLRRLRDVVQKGCLYQGADGPAAAAAANGSAGITLPRGRSQAGQPAAGAAVPMIRLMRP